MENSYSESDGDAGTMTVKECVGVDMDGERLTLTADKEIVLRCGKSCAKHERVCG